MGAAPVFRPSCAVAELTNQVDTAARQPMHIGRLGQDLFRIEALAAVFDDDP